MRIRTVLTLAGFVLSASALAAPPAGLPDVKVTTDTSIDCSSVQSMAADLYRPCKTDQDKAIATWYFIRRVCLHWPDIPTSDPIDLINSYGFALCGQQSDMLCQVLTAGGLKGRLMHPTAHCIAEAYYDDAWHMLDCQMGWYVLNKQGKVASCAEIKADPTIVDDARKEDRASKPFFQCSDNEKSGNGIGSSARAGAAPALSQKRLVINLRRGESITRAWGNEGKPWYNLKNEKFNSPAHGCIKQETDQNDPVNWPFWKPYAKVIARQGDKLVYGEKRYYGNGRMVYEPDLAGPAFAEDLGQTALVNMKAAAGAGGPALRPAEAGKDATAIIDVDCPYVMTDAWLDATGLRKGEKDVLAVAVKGQKGDWKEVYKAEQAGAVKLEKLSLKEAVFGAHKYQVRLTLRAGASAGDVGLDKLALTTVLMNNMYALPYFVPGKNTIKVAAGAGADLSKHKLALEYAWEEEGKDKTLSKAIDKLPFETTVEVGGKEVPKMKHVRLAVAP